MRGALVGGGRQRGRRREGEHDGEGEGRCGRQVPRHFFFAKKQLGRAGRLFAHGGQNFMQSRDRGRGMARVEAMKIPLRLKFKSLDVGRSIF